MKSFVINSVYDNKIVEIVKFKVQIRSGLLFYKYYDIKLYYELLRRLR